jgi:hypothetical protein
MLVNVIAIRRRGEEEVHFHSSGTSIYIADERNEKPGIGQSFSPFAEHFHREGAVLLRLSYLLTPEQNAEYEEALKHII